MIGDTVNLPTIMVTPWPTIESFRQAFVDFQVNDNDLSRANRNMDIETLQELSQFVAPDGSLNFKYAVEQQQSRLYNSNLYPSYSITNPIAWAKFIDAWKKGAFKRKKK
ncbi:MAG: hypothetical protein IPO27_13285 [Bacteroidetes bacterium]|nr:hypothetical protein [Bacteroidota bacterium]